MLSAKKWIVDESTDAIRLSLHSSADNVAVTKCIVLRENAVKIFVHNKPLPNNHFLMSFAKIEDPEDLGSIIDQLFKLANLFQYSNVCSGVKKYCNFWKEREIEGKGFIEERFYSDADCVRSSKCILIDNEKLTCKDCLQEYNLLKSLKYKRDKQGKDRSRVNNRFLSRKELEEKAAKLQEENRKKGKILARLRKRVAKLLERDTINIDADLSEDLAKIFKRHHNKMTDEQRIFWSEQLKALGKQDNPRTMRWNPFVIRIALHLQMISRSAYEYVGNFIKLPSQRRLYDYTHFVEAKEGPQEAIITNVKTKIENLNGPDHETYFNIIFDEMYIRSNIVISKKTGELLGYVNLTKVEEEIAQLEAEQTDATFHANLQRQSWYLCSRE